MGRRPVSEPIPQASRATARQDVRFLAAITGLAGAVVLLAFFLPWLTLFPLGGEATTWSGLQIALGNDVLSVSGYPLLLVTLGASTLILPVALLTFRRQRISPITLLMLAIVVSLGLWQAWEGSQHLLVEYGEPYRLATPGYSVEPGLWLVAGGLSAACLVSLACVVREFLWWLNRTTQAHPPGYYSRILGKAWQVVRLPLAVGLLLAGVLAFLNWNAAESTRPAWSPDGRNIAFESDRDAKRDQNDIYIMDVASGEVRRLTYHPLYDGNAAWSPNGDWLAFVSSRDGLTSLYVIDASGEEIRRLLDPTQGAWDPAWDSSGELIYYSTVRQGRAQTNVVDVESGSLTQMPDEVPWNRGHIVSTSYQRAVFLSSDEGELDLYTCDLEGGNVRRLHTGLEHPGAPAWSPDEQRIAFMAWEGSRRSIYVVNADGSDLRRLTDGRGQDSLPVWAPDGQSLAFVSNRSGRDEVYLVQLDGENLQRLTQSRRIPWLPAWAWARR